MPRARPPCVCASCGSRCRAITDASVRIVPGTGAMEIEVNHVHACRARPAACGAAPDGFAAPISCAHYAASGGGLPDLCMCVPDAVGLIRSHFDSATAAGSAACFVTVQDVRRSIGAAVRRGRRGMQGGAL